MHTHNLPEDSVLRRHAESARVYQQQAISTSEPSDSVLRRHHAQQVAAAAGASPRASSRPVSTAPAPSAETPVKAAAQTESPKPAPAQTSTPVQAAPVRRGGLLGWLSRLFGG